MTNPAVKRVAATSLLVVAVATCGGSDPAGLPTPERPDFTGVWQGEIRNTINTCSPEDEGEASMGEMRIAEIGASNTFQFLDVNVSGTITDSGEISVAGFTQIDGLLHEVSLEGVINGDQLVATHSRTRADGPACTTTYTFDLRRDVP